MAQDEIVVKYKVDASEFGKVGVAVNAVTQETQELGNQIKSTFADKSIEAATKKLFEQGDVMGALVNKYGNATTALKAMEKELATMAALGQRGTASFNELANATAELKDNIGDTRNEIKKMSSDTKVFDTMVQGARGVAAAFSVATGLAATFGSENKDLQKTLMKVQGAMATLQGVQELANIATEKGGIATKAYGVALQVVDKISKITGLSMAASWAVATAGLTILIAGVISLIAYFGQADDAANEYEENRNADAAAAAKRLVEQKEEQIKLLTSADRDFFDKQEIERRERLAKGEEANQVEFDMLTKSIEKYQNKVKGYQNGYYEYLGLTAEEEKSRIAIFNDYINTAVIARNKIIDDGNKAALKAKEDSDKAFGKLQKKQIAEMRFMDEAIQEGLFATADHLQEFRDKIASQPDSQIDPLITEKMVAENKENGDQMAKDFAKIYTDGVKTEADSVAKRKALQDSYFAAVGKGISAVSNLTNAIFAQETQKISEEKEAQVNNLDKQLKKELQAAGDNTAKKQAIEERYAKRKADLEKKHAIETAKIQRQQAIANKIFAIFQIGLSTAQAVVNALGAVPYTPANIGLAAAAGALGALELAAAAAAPLPPIPKFSKGGEVLVGGRNADGHLIGRSHRQGGILLEAEGGEYIWDRQTTAKHNDIIKAAHENRIEDLVMHKYVVPMMKAKNNRTESETYDDMLLRSTIRQSNKQTAKYIVDGISHNMKDTLYFATRYK